MPIKNIAASITAIAPSFRGGVSLRIAFACPKVPDRVGSFWRSPFLFQLNATMSDKKRSKTVAVSLTVAEQTLGCLIYGAKS
jgi:hypothetical protein